ncbi:unnamed protein product [Hermetia illucens]|uniref:Mitochondrial pyruvate carrier n=1 Tax=Hermetia illucens TaxID=343691 RepID=A0A7R8Z2G4_HERIL|nr:mitochondrial pyruvate carrier 2-like isoform X2 [Hermetia illucens]CAD7092958.1 unnamed protein product [Hermetia illucens]
MSELYVKLCANLDRRILPVLPKAVHNFYNSPIGPKTVFFWAPAFKWGLVLAGIGDLARPADQLSIAQSASLAATGIIWSRYSLVIIPKNYSLFAVNLFVGITQIVQLGRAYMHAQSQKNLQSASTEKESVTVPAPKQK